MLDEKLIAVAREVARELPAAYATKGRAKLTEQYHLQPVTDLVVARLAPAWDPAPSLAAKRFGDTMGWVGLGNVDTVFTWPDGSKTFLELKCGSDLSACAWDAVKLAAGVLGGNAASAYMLAALPTIVKKPIRGAELFEEALWAALGPQIRDAHTKWWRLWQNEKTPHIPGRVAATFRTVPLASFPFAINGVQWGLRLVRVDPDGAEWADWVPFPLTWPDLDRPVREIRGARAAPARDARPRP